MKNSPNQHCCQTGVADGTSPLLSMVTVTLMLMELHPFIQKKEGTINGAISTIFKFLQTLIGAKLDLRSFRPHGDS